MAHRDGSGRRQLGGCSDPAARPATLAELLRCACGREHWDAYDWRAFTALFALALAQPDGPRLGQPSQRRAQA